MLESGRWFSVAKFLSDLVCLVLQVEDILRACAATGPVNHVKKDQVQAGGQAISTPQKAPGVPL